MSATFGGTVSPKESRNDSVGNNKPGDEEDDEEMITRIRTAGGDVTPFGSFSL